MTTEGTRKILIVDDEPDIRELLALTLSRMNLDSRGAETLQEARTLLGADHFALCLTDMRLPDGSGIELVRHMQEHYPGIPVAMITAHGNMSSAIEALKAGAFDFLNKPVELQTLRDLVTSALRLAAPPEDTPNPPCRAQLLGDSAAIEAIRTTIRKLARSQAPVYISGESGTGKELAARLIHAQGPRTEGPFIAVNCGAIPADLMESELFGHKKGSFTGATGDKAGLFQAANGGTLFLDEVADLPLAMQVKLLRAIQEKAVRPIGAQREAHIDVRILSATHKDLADEVRQGRFREDLFYRINVIELHMPPLRERPEDIPPLVAHFTRQLGAEMGMAPPTLSGEAAQALASYPFPGNIRELENIIERAMTLCEGNTIDADDLQLNGGVFSDAMATEGATVEEIGLEAYLQNIERDLLQQALEKSHYNKTAAARQLGITFRALRYRLKKLGME
ncbi:MAG: sigma-54 dependent transcriptional regulator [Gammaproteobacteria bacterium]|nr:sigma-54 dependent transcriptional regulator [Gammaproteobacteria bacterium]MCW8958430.1 sigma-54 dependent transcriptional regulator [Gammaproteobacteria bacterium]MCW8973802.1 sigma-54 dependent transcriptional regulator [Gammaproteobacteria bacterium]MCW8993491.1 sigma-54 dependent transcriptional regulator [Gammaproteobacteria bacterium]